ncbi:RNA polymerase sigma factor [soil metagenome]
MKEQFVTFVQENEGIIFKVSKMYAHQREDREDLYQEIVLQLWRSFADYRAEAKISTWMYRIALNTAITHLRKETRRAKSAELDEVALQVPAGLGGEQEERVEAMFRAIQQLTAVEKALVMLYMDDHSYKGMAEIIGISESNIGFKLNKIKAKLKELLKNY